MQQQHKLGFGFNILTETNDAEFDKNSFEAGRTPKQELKPYTEDAAILQSVLEHSIEFGTENYFKSRDLSKNHLLNKCDYYVKLYEGSKVKKEARPEIINPRVVGALEKLAYLELVASKPSEAKNHQPTEEYRFTKLGRMVALLFLCDKVKLINTEIYGKLYSQICEFYGSLNTSHSKFCLIFFQSCKDKKKFKSVLNSLLGLLFNASDDKHAFLDKIKFLNLIYKNDLEMWEIFKDGLKELSKIDYSAYRLFLLNLKLTIEEVQEFKSRNFKDFEVRRLETVQDIEKIVVEGHCNACERFSIASMDTIRYLDAYVKSSVSKRNISPIMCECENGFLDFEIIV